MAATHLFWKIATKFTLSIGFRSTFSQDMIFFTSEFLFPFFFRKLIRVIFDIFSVSHGGYFFLTLSSYVFMQLENGKKEKG